MEDETALTTELQQAARPLPKVDLGVALIGAEQEAMLLARRDPPTPEVLGQVLSCGVVGGS